MAILELLIGGGLVVLVLHDVFQTVVVPRHTGRRMRLAPHVVSLLWPLWRHWGMGRQPAWRRENFLATFAPFVIVMLLVSWVVSIVVGFALVLHAMPDQVAPPLPDFATALYLSATSVLTIGFGDFVATGTTARIAVLVAGAAGLAIFALVISLVFNLYASFARREVLVLLLDSRAGVPPSGVMFLERFGQRNIVDDLAPAFFRYETWVAEMLDSHLAYPLLPFFRSSHDGQSWVSALGAVLDAATLLLSAVDVDSQPGRDGLIKGRAAAEMMYELGCHALIDLTQVRIDRRQVEAAGQLPLIERAEFEAACRQLAAAGYPATCSEAAWSDFARRRGLYAVRLNLLARYFASIPTQWIGDRSLVAHRELAHIRA
jgi:hypothetical protein